MLVRNRLTTSRYKAHLVETPDAVCPCRSCYHVHDCGFREYGGKWIERFACATNYNTGCPDPKPRPLHIIHSKVKSRRRGQTRVCLRCGQEVVLGSVNFLTVEAYKLNLRGC